MKMPRTLKWVETHKFMGFGCSECAWVFDPSGLALGKSLEEMKKTYETQRDKEFDAHACINHPQHTKPGKGPRLAP